MKNRILLAFLLGLLCSLSGYTQTATVITVKSNIRESAQIDANVIVVVNKGVKLKLLSTEHENGWYNVKYGKKEGWIHGNNIKLDGDIVDRFLAQHRITKSKDKWIYYAASSDGKYYYNAGTMVRSGVTRRVWAKMVFLNSYDTGSMVQYDIKCSSGQYRTMAGVIYYPSGDIKQSLTRPVTYFSTAIPETIMAALVGAVC